MVRPSLAHLAGDGVAHGLANLHGNARQTHCPPSERLLQQEAPSTIEDDGRTLGRTAEGALWSRSRVITATPYRTPRVRKITPR